MIVMIIISLFRYHLPRSWLQPTRNLLVVFEEVGGNAEKISLTKRTVCGICASVSEFHPTVQNFHVDKYGQPEESSHLARVHLRCSPGQSISAIKFASFGTPSGSCGSFQEGTCHSPSSRSILEEVTFSPHFSLLIIFNVFCCMRLSFVFFSNFLLLCKLRVLASCLKRGFYTSLSLPWYSHLVSDMGFDFSPVVRSSIFLTGLCSSSLSLSIFSLTSSQVICFVVFLIESVSRSVSFSLVWFWCWILVSL